MIAWNQLDGNNIEVEGYDLAGFPKSPAYNNKLGFKHGRCFLKEFFCLFFCFLYEVSNG